MMKNCKQTIFLLCTMLLFGLAPQALAQQSQPTQTVVPTEPQDMAIQPVKPVSAEAASPPILGTIKPDDTSRFCKNIDEAAADAHFELRRRELETLRTQVDERIKILEQKRQEYEVWLKKRDDFLGRTQDSFVDIIAKMRPDAASAQLALVDDMTVAGLMLKLKPATASTIMNELPAEKAANITHILASAQKLPGKKQPTSIPQPVE